MSVKEYPTLTALMAGREPGSVKVRSKNWAPDEWARAGAMHTNGMWFSMSEAGRPLYFKDDEGPWLIVSEDAPALDTMRLEIAARVLAALHGRSAAEDDVEYPWETRHAYALAEADALIEEARK